MKRKSNYKTIISFLFVVIIILGSIFYKPEDNNSNKIEKREVENVVNLSEGSKLKIYFLDVGQADSILLTNNDKYMLIDAGNNADGSKLVKYFHDLGIETFDYVVGTHAHEDHIGGMDDIVDSFNINNFYMPDALTTTKTFEDVLDALDKKSIAYQVPEVDSTFDFGDCTFEILYSGTDTKDLNDSSIVLKMSYGAISFLFMGDATSKVEEKIINKDVKSDVMKIGHHGSRYSSSSNFLEEVHPQYVIISVGENNTYKHPHAITLKRLEKIQARVYRTDRQGTIVLDSDGENITFETIKTDTNG